ncbi:type VI secretion system baseplate subunit TssF [Pseudoduganella albidiflava]|nr:type VI secretion system baseplate subunit TssF [Pseudoduganella albidiflava]
MMDQLIPYLQEELATFRRDINVLAVRYPRLAGALGITEDACGDPEVERLFQGCALFSARIARKLDAGHPKLIVAVLQSIYPHYLCPFPSCSVIQVEHKEAQMRGPRTIARGTELKSRVVQGVRCQFRTACDIVLSPLAVSCARFVSSTTAPTGQRIDSAYDAALSISFSSTVPIKQLGMERLSLFIDGDPSLCATLRDTLFLRTGPAFVQAPDERLWHKLTKLPVRPAGFEDDEGLLPWPARSHPAYRLLTEYFSFPDKFNFIEVDLAAILAAAPHIESGFTLHLPVRGSARDTSAARTLASFTAGHLRTHCAPVINLFNRGAAPIDLHRRVSEYPLTIDLARPAASELYSVDTVRLVTGNGTSQRIAELQPFYGDHHGQGQASGYWLVRRNDITADCEPGREIRMTIVDDEMQPKVPEAQTLSVDVTCSNRDVPTLLSYGAADGDLQANGILDSSPIRFLRKPTPSRRFPTDGRAHWRLVAHLALNQRTLSDVGLVELRKMLNLYDLPHSPATQRQIGGIVGLSSKTVHEWVKGAHRTALMAGLDIRLTVDESAYVGSGLHVFAQMLDRFFALYGQINVFTRLVLVSAATEEEILKCQPRSGTLILA